MNNELKNEPNKTIHVIYHIDPDGYMSCSIIQKYLDDNAKLFEEYRKNYIPMNYDYKTDWINDITSEDIVFMSDFSLPFDKMKQINDKLNGKRFHWIDHHESSINKILNQENIENKLNNMSYLARVGEAGCELTWKYLFGEDSEIPPAVTLIGRYDVWDKETELHDWENEILPFIAYCNSKDFDPFKNIYLQILPYNLDELKVLIKEGQKIIEVEDNYHRKFAKQYAFDINIDGYRGIAMPIRGSSMIFKSIYNPEVYDFMFGFIYNGKTNNIIVSMYTDKDDIALNKIAERYGGGGHRKACGFVIDDFNELLRIVGKK